MSYSDDDRNSFDDNLRDETERKWLLNGCISLRDNYRDKDKFFVTYFQTTRRRWRLTITCNYRNAPFDSIEAQVKSASSDWDKSLRIYSAVRHALQDVDFYDTVTNLNLQTIDDELHIHSSEDLIEVIRFPTIQSARLQHVQCRQYMQKELTLDSHLFGYVSKVGVGKQVFIEKEIPGPDAVEGFLHELDALYQASKTDSKSDLWLGGIVVDDEREEIRGLLIGFKDEDTAVHIVSNQADGF
jgi:hypothetical protein